MNLTRKITIEKKYMYEEKTFCKGNQTNAIVVKLG